MKKVNTINHKQEGSMKSVDEFYFRYYTNRLLREGYIDQQEYQALLASNQLDIPAPKKRANVNSTLSR